MPDDFSMQPGDVSGRKIMIAAKQGVAVTTAGTANHVALIDAPGMPFHDPKADAALFDASRSGWRDAPNHRLIEIDANINDPAFQLLLENLLKHISRYIEQNTVSPSRASFGFPSQRKTLWLRKRGFWEW